MNEMSKLFSYEGNDITFRMADGTVMVNATEIAKAFKKRVPEWTRLESTKEFLDNLYLQRSNLPTEVQNMHYEIKRANSKELKHILSCFNNDLHLIVTVRGGNSQGTWMHEDVAMEFARWLSPRFAIWCNQKMKELITNGAVVLNGNINQFFLDVCQRMNATLETMNQMMKSLSEQKQKQIEQVPNIEKNFMTVREYCIKHRKYAPKEVAVEYGKRCSALCNVNGITIRKVDDDKWGKINTYPIDILETVIK